MANQPDDPRRKLAPYIGAAVALFVVLVIVSFTMGKAPDRTEPVPVAADPGAVGVTGSAPRPSTDASVGTAEPVAMGSSEALSNVPIQIDAGIVPLVDSGVVDPEVLADAMKQVGSGADAG